MWAWKQPSFKESVKAHWCKKKFKCFPKIHRRLSNHISKLRIINYIVVVEFAVYIHIFIKKYRNICIKNADMSSNKKCEKHFHRKSKGFQNKLVFLGVSRSLKSKPVL